MNGKHGKKQSRRAGNSGNPAKLAVHQMGDDAPGQADKPPSQKAKRDENASSPLPKHPEKEVPQPGSAPRLHAEKQVPQPESIPSAPEQHAKKENHQPESAPEPHAQNKNDEPKPAPELPEKENRQPESAPEQHAQNKDYESKPAPELPKKEDHQPEPAPELHAEKENAQPEPVPELAGIRFAPWNVPIRRRLQTVAVIVHSLIISTTVTIFFLLCAIPLTWPLLIAYLIYMLTSTAATDGTLRFRSERLRKLPLWTFFAEYFPATLHKTEDLTPTRKYIFGYHPHGIISHGAFAAFATEGCGFGEKFPGLTNSLLTLDPNFRIPLYREYALAMGLRSVSKESIGNILSKGGLDGEGMGRAVTIVLGGARESLEAQPGTMRLILKERKGFIKLAMRTGADLVPVVAFGENDLYDQVSPKRHPSIKRLQLFVLRTLKFTTPFLHGRGIFNYDVGLMPYRRPLNIVVGAPIKVAQSHSNAVDGPEVDRLHSLYVDEVTRMWDRYKDEFSPDRKEELILLS